MNSDDNNNPFDDAFRFEDEVDLEIDAHPTKSLFVSMLTKDLSLIDTIEDLIDNSVDGAKRLRTAIGPFTGLDIDIRMEDSKFSIKDNCGGMSIEIAKNYAFRFGRPDKTEMLATPGSVGRFGIGMKRAFFKMGRKFTVDSTTKDERFSLVVDVDEWLKHDDWHFKFHSIESGTYSVEECGLSIVVERLHEDVQKEFIRYSFQNQVERHVSNSQSFPILKGLAMRINGSTVAAHAYALLSSDDLKPYLEGFTLENEDEILEKKADINIRIFAGIADSKPREAGWYVFCNGRALLQADQSEITGWNNDITVPILNDSDDEDSTDEVTDQEKVSVPRYHNQYSRFRGFVYFDCDEGAYLPWNTTKTSVEVDSPVYKFTKQRMIQATRQVLNFLNELDREKDTTSTELEELVKRAKPTALAAVVESPVFFYKAGEPAKPSQTRISYQVPIEKFEAVKDELEATSNKQVGLETFDYFYEMRVEE